MVAAECRREQLVGHPLCLHGPPPTHAGREPRAGRVPAARPLPWSHAVRARACRPVRVVPVLNRLDLRGVTDADLAARLPRPDLAATSRSRPSGPILAEVRDRRRRGRPRAHRALRRRASSSDLRVDPDRAAGRRSAPTPTPTLRDALEEARDAIEAFHRDPAAARPPPRARRHRRRRPHDVPVDRAGLLRARWPGRLPLVGAHDRRARPGSPASTEVVLCVPPDRDDRPASRRRRWPPPPWPASTRSTPSAGPRPSRAMAYGTETHPRRSTSSSVPATSTWPWPSARWPAWSACPRPSPGRPRSWWWPTTPRRPTYAAIDVIVQAEHGPDGLAWLITWSTTAADAIDAEIDRLVGRGAAPGRHRGATSPEAATWPWSTVPTQAMAVANLIAPEHLAAHERRPRGAGAAGAQRRRGVLRRRWPRPRSATTWPAPATCCPPSARPASPARSPSTTSVKHVHVVTVDQAGFERRGARTSRRWPTAEGFDAHAESIRLRRRRPIAAPADGQPVIRPATTSP